MKYVLCPEIQSKTHKWFKGKKEKKSSTLTLGWSASQILAGLPVLEAMEHVAQSLVLRAGRISASAPQFSSEQDHILPVELPFVSSAAFPFPSAERAQRLQRLLAHSVSCRQTGRRGFAALLSQLFQGVQGSWSLFEFPAMAKGAGPNSLYRFLLAGERVPGNLSRWLRTGWQWKALQAGGEVSSSLWGLCLLPGGDLDLLEMVVTSDGGSCRLLCSLCPFFKPWMLDGLSLSLVSSELCAPDPQPHLSALKCLCWQMWPSVSQDERENAEGIFVFYTF